MLIQPRPDNHERHTQDAGALSPRGLSLQATLTLVIESYAPPKEQSASERANFAETVVRAAKAWNEVFGLDDPELSTHDHAELLSETVEDVTAGLTSKAQVIPRITEILETGFPTEAGNGDCGIVTQGPIYARGMCPHHLLPVSYEVFVGYKPLKGGTVLGLSKLARVAQLLAQRPVLQEQVASDIADALFYDAELDRADLPQIRTQGSAVQLIGAHSCMSCRGVLSDANTLSTTLRGMFLHDSAKAEFYQAIESLRHARCMAPIDDSDEDEQDDNDI